MADDGAAGTQRIDKWLWYARIVKSRTLAATLVQTGKVRVNRQRTDKPSHALRRGDVVTVTAHRQVRVLEVSALGARRGPAAEAQTLYTDLTQDPPSPNAVGRRSVSAVEPTQGRREYGAGRPTKRDRRAIDRLRDDP